MEDQQNLTKEVKKLNRQLEKLTKSGKYMIYSANPFKFSLFNFLSGIFHTLGSLFGYIVIFGVLAYIFSQVNLNGLISNWMEKTLGGVNWDKVIPAPKSSSGLNLDGTQIKRLEKIMGGQPKEK